jgi:hypothetical protein
MAMPAISPALLRPRPSRTSSDPVLGEGNLTGFYATIHMPIIKALAPWQGRLRLGLYLAGRAAHFLQRSAFISSDSAAAPAHVGLLPAF